MVDWEKELKKYIAKKIKNTIGLDVSPAEILAIKVNTDIDLTLLEIEDLALVYAFAIMEEDFEHAKAISDELNTRKCEVKIDIDDFKKTGVINIYKQSETSVICDVKLKVLPSGMMIDFENQNF